MNTPIHQIEDQNERQEALKMHIWGEMPECVTEEIECAGIDPDDFIEYMNDRHCVESLDSMRSTAHCHDDADDFIEYIIEYMRHMRKIVWKYMPESVWDELVRQGIDRREFSDYVNCFVGVAELEEMFRETLCNNDFAAFTDLIETFKQMEANAEK